LLRAGIVAERTGVRTASLVRSFVIDPLFSYAPDPQLSSSRGYQTWSWEIPLGGRASGELATQLSDADRALTAGGYCGPDDRGAYLLTVVCVVEPNNEAYFIQEWCDGQFWLDDRAVTGRDSDVDLGMCLVPAGESKPLALLDLASQTRVSDICKATRHFRDWVTGSQRP